MKVMKFLFNKKFLYFVKIKKGEKWREVDSEDFYVLLKKHKKNTVNTVIYTRIIL